MNIFVLDYAENKEISQKGAVHIPCQRGRETHDRQLPAEI